MKRKSLLFLLLLALMAPWAAQAQELTVYENTTTTNYYVPMYVFYFDDYTRAQTVFPADDLAPMTGGTITDITFYTTSSNIPYTTVSSADIYLTEVASTTISSYIDQSSATTVCTGYYDFVSDGEGGGLVTITLTTPYQYNGGNLLFGCDNTEDTGYKQMIFKGVTATGASISGSNGTAGGSISASSRNFLPKTTFTYIPAGGLTCDRPESIAYEGVTTNSATINWTGGSGTYNVEYKKESETEWTSALTNTTATSYELTGLAPGTNYQARVQSTCGTNPETGDAVISGWKSVSFATSFGIPLIEPFATTTLPTGWARYSGLLSDVMNGTALTTTTSGWLIGNYNNVFDTHTRVNIYGTTCKYWLVTPTLLMEDNVELSFDLALTVFTSSSSASPTPGNQADDRFVVLITTDGGATWEILREWNNTGSEYVYDNITNASTGQYETIDLSSYAGQNIAVAFYGESTVSGGDNNLHVDNISIDYIPSCSKPTGLAYSEVAGHTANLTWTPGAEGQTQWQICVNGDEENLIPVTSADGAYTLTGLTGVTPYTVKVRAYCSDTDQSPWSNEVSFTTTVTCVAPTAFTATDVTNRTVKLSWTSDATEWIVAYKVTGEGDDTYVEVPVTENPYILEGLTPETGYTVKVRANCGEEDGLSTWTATRTFTTLEAYPAPNNVTVDSVFAYTAYFSWNERGDAQDWEVAYKLATDTEYTMSELTPENHPFILGELDPLTPGTDYVFKVRSIYFTEQGDTASAWSNEVAFTTLLTCPAPTEVAVIDSTINAHGATLNWHSVYSDSWNVKYREPAYIDGVIEEFGTAIPTGWEMYTGLLDNGTATMTSATYGWNFGTGNGVFDNHARVNIYGNNQRWLVMPAFIVPSGIELGFDLALTAFSGTNVPAPTTTGTDDKFIVLISTDDMATWTTLREWNNEEGAEYVYNNIANTATGEHVSIDLSAYAGQNVRIAFYGESTTSNADNNVHIDNVALGVPVPATEWQTVLAEEVPFELTGLNPETYYEVVVSGNCSEEISEESASVFFTTAPSCLAPEGLALAHVNDSLTAHTATLSWTENGSATEWVIEYTAIINDSTTVMNSINVTENPYTLMNLLDATPYTAKVQAYCSETDQSDWSNTVRFVTPIACPAPTELAVDSITTEGATLTWNGNSESYIVMIGEPDPDNIAESTMLYVDFNNQVIPATWTNDATYPFTVVDGHIQSSNAGVASSTSSISFTMTFDSNVTIEFDAQCRGEGTSYDVCKFLIDNDVKFTKGANGEQWDHYSYEVTAGEHTFTWSYTKDSSVNPTGDYFAVDNIKVTGLIPSPSSWTEYPAEESPYTFENLEPGTTYFVQVQSNCEGEQPYVSNMISFTTVASCVAPTEVEVTDVAAHTATMVWIGDNDSYLVNLGVNEPIILESADFAEEIPASWDNTSDYLWTIVNGHMQSGNGGIASSTSTISSTVTFPANGTIEFDAECMGEGTYSYYDHCDFYIDNTRMLYHGAELGSGWYHYSYDVPAGEHTFTWSYTKDSSVNPTGDYFAVDNVAMKVSNIIWNEEPYAAADTTYTFNELLAEHTYYTQVQGVCGEETSAWSEIISFTTTVACPAPINLAIANVTDSITGHTATINWIETGSATAWEICLNNDENNLILANDTIITLTGLRQDNDYTVMVRANCGELDGTSAWSNTVSFHTLVTCVAPTNLTVDNIGTESATLMWEGTSDSYVVQLMPWNQVGSDQAATGVLTTYTYDLSEYEGMGSVAIRHYDVSDMFQLNVDDIVVTNAAGDIVYTQDFETGTVPAEISNMDLDGDGYVWGIRANGEDNQGNPYCNDNYCASSASWISGVALHPDNWMIISGIELGGQITFVARGQDPAYPSENFAVYVSPENGFVEEYVEGQTSLDVWDLTPYTPYAWQVASICDADTSNWVASFFTTLDDVLVFVTDGDWDNPENWDPNQLPTVEDKVRVEANAIIPAGVVAEANKINIVEGNSITIKDGGQLKQSSATLKVTMEKEIAGYGEGNDNFYFIASPFTGRTKFSYDSGWSHVLNVTTESEYDLYAFDGNNGEDEEWVNYKSHSSDHIAFISEPTSSGSGNPGMDYGRGYLYANQVNDTLRFTGVTPASNNASMEIGYAYDTINKGWELVGNPYTCTGYLSFLDGDGEVSEANFYVMNATGDDIELAETADGIAPLTGAFVNFQTTGYVHYSSEAPNPAKFNTTGKFIMNLSQDGNMVDKAVVRFGKGSNLEKMSLKNNSKLYFSMKDKDYAVVYSNNAGNMPVNFKAENAGSYTINFSAENVSFKELVLIDNATETKVDLLANPSYTFDSEAGEFAGRFTIVYKVK